MHISHLFPEIMLSCLLEKNVCSTYLVYYTTFVGQRYHICMWYTIPQTRIPQKSQYCLLFIFLQNSFWKYFWYYENFTQCHLNVKELELVTVWKSYLQEELTMLQYRWNEVDINCGKHSNPTKFILCSDHRNIFSHC